MTNYTGGCSYHKFLGCRLGSTRDHDAVWCGKPVVGTWCHVGYCEEHLNEMEPFARENDLLDSLVRFST